MFPWDFRYVQVPLISFLADQLRLGRLAIWDPFTYCGDPIFANIQASLFHPFVFAAAFISGHFAPDLLPLLLEWAVVAQIWIGGISAWFLFRKIGAGIPSAFAGALIFQTGSFVASRMEHIGTVMAVAWMPLAWLFVFRLRDTVTYGSLCGLAVSLALSLLGGFPQATLAVYVSTVVLAIVLWSFRMSQLRTVLWTLVGCAISIALASVQFLPTVQVTENGVGKYRAGWLSAFGGGLHWESLVSLIIPNHFNIFDLAKFTGPGDPTFLYLYSSIAGLVLVFVAVIVSRTRTVFVFASLGLFGAFFMLGESTALWRWMYPSLPVQVRIGIHPEYTYSIFTLSVAALAALGLDALRIRNAIKWMIALIIGLDLLLVGSNRPMNTASILDEPGLTRFSFDGDGGLLRGVRELVNRQIPPARIDTLDASINWSECAPLTRVPTADGCSPLALENIIQARLLLHEGHKWGWYYPVANAESPILDVMNVKYLLVGPKGRGKVESLPKYRHVASFQNHEVFENLTVLPRFFLVHGVRQVISPEEARQLIERQEVDLHKAALVTDTPPPGIETNDGAFDRVEVLKYEPTALKLSVTTPVNSLLVLSEQFYPGWDAWVDGEREKIYLTDIAFRGVVIPPGSHTLRMEFRPGILTCGSIVSGGSLLLVCYMACFWKRPIRVPSFRKADLG